VAYPISYRQLEEMMQERGVEVDHSTLNRWVLKYGIMAHEHQAHG
jgi:putative transposase